MSWEDQALCATDPTVDPALFFPVGTDSKAQARQRINDARKVCFRCPVRIRCLNHALGHGEEGTWGGTTDYERRSLTPKAETA